MNSKMCERCELLMRMVPASRHLAERLRALAQLVKSESEVAQSCWTPRDPMDCSLPSLGFSRQEYWSGLPFPTLVHLSFCLGATLQEQADAWPLLKACRKASSLNK